jgi:hypothetical protein
MSERDIKYYRRRLQAHRWRLRYWSGLPSFSGFGPSGKSCKTSIMDENYELAMCDARSICQILESLGDRPRVVDVRATFRNRFYNTKADEILIWPRKK